MNWPAAIQFNLFLFAAYNLQEARLGLDGQVAQAIHQSRMKPNSAHLETNFIARQTELVNAMEAALASIRYQAGGSPWPRAACLTDKAIFYVQQMTVAHKQARELYDANVTQQMYGRVATGFTQDGYTPAEIWTVRRAQHFCAGPVRGHQETGMQTERKHETDSAIQCQADELCDEMDELRGVTFEPGTGRDGQYGVKTVPWMMSKRGKHIGMRAGDKIDRRRRIDQQATDCSTGDKIESLQQQAIT